MRYLIKTLGGIIYASYMALDDHALKADETEITKEQYENLTLPAVWDEEGNLVPSDIWPETPVAPVDPGVEPVQEATAEEILDVLLGVN